jgi:hypothetical protein
MLTDKELQSLRNLGNEGEAAADEIVALREALAGTVHVLDALRTYGKAKYEYAQGRAGSMLRVQNVIESATALLTPNYK